MSGACAKAINHESWPTSFYCMCSSSQGLITEKRFFRTCRGCKWTYNPYFEVNLIFGLSGEQLSTQKWDEYKRKNKVSYHVHCEKVKLWLWTKQEEWQIKYRSSRPVSRLTFRHKKWGASVLMRAAFLLVLLISIFELQPAGTDAEMVCSPC